MDDKLLKLEQVEDITGLKKSALYELIDINEFPNSISVGKGKRAKRWPNSKIQEWIKRQIQMAEAV